MWDRLRMCPVLFDVWWENAILCCPFFSAGQERWALLPEEAYSE